MPRASMVWQCNGNTLIFYSQVWCSIAVPTIDKPDISFHGNALEHGVDLQFQAGAIKFSAQVPPDQYTMHLEALLEWFAFIHIALHCFY